MKKQYKKPLSEIISNEPEVFLAGSGTEIGPGSGTQPGSADSKSGSTGWEDDDESEPAGW